MRKPGAEAIKLLCYADDITVMVRNGYDIQGLKEALKIYEGASSAKLNWEKNRSIMVWALKEALYLTSQKMFKWGKSGFKFLGVYLGKDEYRMKNWEG